MKTKIIVFAATAATLSALSYAIFRGPEIAPPSTVTLRSTPTRLARGEYIFRVVGDCEGCHSERDFAFYAGPAVPGRTGVGVVFPKDLGLPGKINAPNITPDPETGLGRWTDGEILRAVREGISRDGRALFPMMPYKNFARMSDEDAASLVVYLRTLPPVRNSIPRSVVDFPVNFLIERAPKPVSVVKHPDHRQPVQYGEYLATIAGCQTCHSRSERGEAVKGMTFAGGQTFHLGKLTVQSANITPDMETGIGSWSVERFQERFLSNRNLHAGNLPIATQANFTIMPWLNFRNLKQEDIAAIYAYLRTVKPVRNKVVPHEVGIH
jgi:hypothetical protein